MKAVQANTEKLKQELIVLVIGKAVGGQPGMQPAGASAVVPGTVQMK